MAKLTKAEFNKVHRHEKPTQTEIDNDKKELIKRLYEWQQDGNVYAWDKESLREELQMDIDNFTLSGKNKKDTTIEIEFYQPIDEDVDNEGVAFGYRLIQVEKGFYNLKKYRHKRFSETANDEADEEVE